MVDMKLFLELVANSAGFKTELGKARNAVTRFSQGARREFDALKGSLNTVTAKLAGLGVTFGVVQQMMVSARLDKGLTQIGQTAGEGSGKVRVLRSDLFAMGKQTGQNVEDLKEGFNSLVQSGLTMKEAKETLDGINTAMAVTGANANTLSSGLTVAATAFQFDLAKPGKALELLDKMTVAGRLGNAELENLSTIFARIGVNASSAGMGFDKTLGFIEALSMVERQPERLATLADSTLRVFTNLRYMVKAQQGTGVKFFDKDGSRRDALEVLKDIKGKYDLLKTDREREVFIFKAFGEMDLDTVKGLRTLLQGASLNKVSSFSKQIENAGGTLTKDLDTAMNNLVDQAGRLKNVLRQAADEFAQPVNAVLSDAIKWALDSKKNGGLELSGKEMIVGGATGLVGTLLAARYGGKAIGSLATRFLKGAGSTAAGIAEGKAVEAATGVSPVFVTNWPLKWMRGESSPIDALKPGALTSGGILDMASKSNALKNLLPFAGKAGLFGLAATGGILAGTGLNWALNKMIEKITGEDKGLGGVIYDWLHKDAVKNNISITIDKDGRVLQEGNMETGLTVNRGSLAPAY